ncbi:hypothetical protein GCM10020221_24410 [Streptomyces thioluteus]|uniref:Uncharacterized protein n=1 Tax=Streptomyces thioluteus TaxID=66431 RepID=A0ABP6JCT5_STRTU
MDPDETPEDPEEFYDHNWSTWTSSPSTAPPVGRITEIAHLPSQDLFIVERPDGGEVMIPSSRRS